MIETRLSRNIVFVEDLAEDWCSVCDTTAGTEVLMTPSEAAAVHQHLAKFLTGKRAKEAA